MNKKTVFDISLIVLTYNRPQGLKACLESIRNMKTEGISYELIVVDDGSTIDNIPVISKFKNSLSIRYHKKENGGVASARNTGAKSARGSLVAFIADDYRLPENYLQDVCSFFDRQKDAYVITHNIDPTGPSIFRYVQRLYFQLTLLQTFDPQIIKSDVIKSYALPPSRGAVFKKGIFDVLGFFNEDFLTGEDGEFGMRMAARNIPIYFFPSKYIDHWEDRDLLGYLEQRIRYGRSFFRAIQKQNSGSYKKPSFIGIIKSIANKYTSWLKLSFKIARGTEYVILSPFILIFLMFYYCGFYLESKRTSLSFYPNESRVDR